MEEKKINVKRTMKLEDVITYLEDLQRGFNSGIIVAEHGAEKIEMEVADIVNIEFKIRKKKSKNKFTLELSWFEDDITDSETFIISDKAESDIDEIPEESTGDTEALQGEIPATSD